MNYVERHFGDWARDTAHLSMLEDGAYNRLCDLYYVREEPLPADLHSCCRLVRAAAKPEREAVRSVLTEFFVLTAEGWRHKRCDIEIERFRDRSNKAKGAAAASVAARKAAAAQRNENEGSTNDERTLNERSTEDAAGVEQRAAAGARPSPLPTSQSPLPSSEATASAATAAHESLSPKDRVWLLGIALLGEKGRSLLGKLASTYGDEVLADVLGDATRDPPHEPKAWIAAACEARVKARTINGKHQQQTDLLGDPKPVWALRAGFPDRFHAENAGCLEHNAHKFRDGQRLQAS